MRIRRAGLSCAASYSLAVKTGSAVPQGVTQMGVTAGSYSEQYTFQSSYGTAKPLESELKMLGISPGRAGWLPLTGDDE